eukprot:747663-Hanusia_phi.AAC.1
MTARSSVIVIAISFSSSSSSYSEAPTSSVINHIRPIIPIAMAPIIYYEPTSVGLKPSLQSDGRPSSAIDPLPPRNFPETLKCRAASVTRLCRHVAWLLSALREDDRLLPAWDAAPEGEAKKSLGSHGRKAAAHTPSSQQLSPRSSHRPQ